MISAFLFSYGNVIVAHVEPQTGSEPFAICEQPTVNWAWGHPHAQLVLVKLVFGQGRAMQDNVIYRWDPIRSLSSFQQGVWMQLSDLEPESQSVPHRPGAVYPQSLPLSPD